VLHVRLLGALEVRFGRRLIAAPPSRRAWALLGWLALHPGDHARGTVAARFWPDVLDSSARASLRSATWNLRQALGPGAQDALVADRDRVGLRCETDLAAFDALLAAGDLRGAVALGDGPVLADFDDDWVLEARDRHAERLGEALAVLSDRADTPQEAVALARRRLALDPLGERAACALMQHLAAAGDRAGAFSVYDRLAERLRTQLGLAPSAVTRQTVAALRAVPAPTPVAVSPGPPMAPAGGWPLVGREVELGALLSSWPEPGGRLAVLTGEGGIGKTRLAREVAARAAADGARTAACASLELGGPAPYTLWAELLHELAATLAPAPAEATWPEELGAIAPSLPRRLGRDPGRPPPAVAPELARARLFEAAVEAVEHACADRPLVLLFEDVHLADAASLELLAYAARRFGDLPVLVLLTRRRAPERPDVDALIHAHHARGGAAIEIELPPLPRAAIDTLVRSVATLSADAHEQVIDAADGNPLLAVESARAAAGDHPGPPPSLQTMVRGALGRLEPGARRAAELAAVAGRDLSRAEVDALATLDDVLGALDSGLFAADRQGLGYRHALLREAVRVHLPGPRRRARHGELALALRGSAAETARHLRLAGRDDQAAERLAGAAAEAIGVGAVGEAIAFLTEALELRDSDPALLLDLAQAHAWNGDHEAAQAALVHALELLPAGDHAARAAAHVRAAKWYSGALCRPQRTIEEAQLGLRELAHVQTPDRDVLATALAMGAWGASVAGSVEEADALLDRLDGLEPFGHELLQYEAANARAFRALRDGRLEDAMARFYETVGLTASAPDCAYSAWVNLSCIAAALGRFEEGLRCAESADVRGLPPMIAPLQAIRASLLMRLDRVDEARAAVALEREAALRSGMASLVALADHDEGQLALAAGEYDRAAELLARALDHQARVSRAAARLARAEALARAGQADAAEAELRQVTLEPVGHVDRPGVLVARLTHVQGLVARAHGDHALAAQRLAEAAAAWRRSPGGQTGAGDLLANLVDLGRPAIGTVEPARELQRLDAELAHLRATATTTTNGAADADLR
jgi:DNA-binding SARP family transcriptional activator/tetratricopeptide (TPR) repeat protein